MKRHLRVAGSNAGTPVSADAGGLVSAREPHRLEAAATRRGGARLHLASVRPWEHTLVLTGTLDRSSAAELEEEIECLCEEGVTRLTLDLRLLEELDATGARVLAFRSALCRRRGYELTVIPGLGEVHSVLLEAGVPVQPMPASAELAPELVGMPAVGVQTTTVRDL
jgi:anti-anti-sigma regulatory factor